MTFAPRRTPSPRRRLAAVCGAMALAGFAGLSLLPVRGAQAQPGLRFVDDDAGCAGQSPCYATIQAAVHAAADGDLIRVAAGHYAESVLVEDKGLSFEGPGAGAAGAAARPDQHAIWEGRSGGLRAPALVVDARLRDVTGLRVQGFRIVSATVGVALLGRRPGDAVPVLSGRPASTVATTVQGAWVRDNLFADVRDPSGLLQGAVLATWSADLQVTGNQVQGAVTGIALWAPVRARVANNDIQAPEGVGIQVLAHGDGLDLIENTVAAAGARALEVRDLVRPGLSGRAKDLRITGNQVTDPLAEGIAVVVTDGGQLTGVQLADNRVTDAGARAPAGVALFHGAIAVAAVKGSITDVSATGDVVRRTRRPGRTEGAGLALMRLDGEVRVSRLLASDGEGPGLLLADLPAARVTSSVVSRNGIGVAVVETPASRSGAARRPLAAADTGIVLGAAVDAGNQLGGNIGPSLVLDNQTGSPAPTMDVDARYNDWNVAYTPDIEALVRHQPDDATVGRVTYLPALGVPDRVTLSAEPPRLVADGLSTSQLSVRVLDAAGLAVADGALVALGSDLGRLAPAGALVEVEAPPVQRLGLWTTLSGPAFGPYGGDGYLRTRDPGARLVWTFDAPAVAINQGLAPSAEGSFRVQVNRQDLGLFSTIGPDRLWAWRLLARDLGVGPHTVTVTLQSGELNVDQLLAGSPTVRGGVTAQLQAALTVGTARVKASAVGAQGTRTGELSLPFTAGPASRLALSVAAETLPVGGATTTLKAEAWDSWGRPVPDGTAVRFSVSQGSVLPATALSVNGVATAVVASSTETGVVALRAESGQAWATDTLTFVPGPPAQVEVTSNRPTVPANSQSTTDLTVLVRDAWGHFVPDGTSVALSTTLGLIEQPLLLTQAGAVRTPLRAGRVAGTARVLARSGAATGALSVSLVAPNLRVVKRVEPQAVVLPGETVTFTLELANVGSGTVYDPVITDVLPAGLVTRTLTALKLPNLSELKPGPAYRWHLDRLRPGERGAITMTLTVNPDFAWGPRTELWNELSMFSPSSAERSPEDNVSRALLVVVPFAAYTVTLTVPERLAVGGTTGQVLARVVDRAGRPAPDGTKVYFAADLGSVTPAVAYTRGGVAKVTFITGTQSGVAAIRAETQEERGATGFVRVVAGPPQKLELASSRPWLHVGGDTAVITATMSDAFANPSVGEPMQLTTALGAFDTGVAVQSIARGSTGVTGQFTATLVSGVRTGTAVVTAQSGMLLRRLEIPFRPGPPEHVSIRLSVDQVAVGVPVDVIGLVQDAFGNPLAEVPVLFATQVGRLASTTGTTDARGEARTTLRGEEPDDGIVSVTAAGKTAFTGLSIHEASVYLPLAQKPKR